jgi:hypothetical protein
MDISYSKACFTDVTIQNLADKFSQAIIELVESGSSIDSTTYTPSDFELINLDQSKLDKLIGKVNLKKK